MRRKTLIITVVLLITIALIGTLRFFIKKDTIQTQKDRLNYFSDNLTIQTNTILGSLQNYSTLIIEGLNDDSILLSKFNSLNWEQNPDIEKNVQILSLYYHDYSKRFEKIGFSPLTFTVRPDRYKNYSSIAGRQFENPATSTQAKCPALNFWGKPLSTYQFRKNIFEYNYLYPYPLANFAPAIFIETGFDFSLLKEMVSKNIPNSTIGFLIVGDSSVVEKSAQSNIQFAQLHERFNLYFDKHILEKIDDFLDEKTLNQINTGISETTLSEGKQSFSIYHSLKQKSKALSFKLLEFHNQEGKFFLVSLSNDFMLDKTNDWNNQIFLINLIIIILIMIGITYLFINRVSLLKEKKFIAESEMKLKEINKTKDRFFSIIAHDLKNPFNGIMGMTGYLNESYEAINDNERKEIINDLNLASKNAFNLLQNLLEWTRTQSGTIKNIPVKIDPATIIEIALETVGNLAKNKEIEIKHAFETTKFGYADENLVATVLRNLFTNAVKFSPRKSEIEVNVKDFEHELVFCVKDAGIGLRHDEIDQLFRIDLNFHKKGTEDETGTGLGLKICKEFVEYCRGRIWVVSEPKKGSCFYFTIPLYPE
jgi:signal transduction histidine kinase